MRLSRSFSSASSPQRSHALINHLLRQQGAPRAAPNRASPVVAKMGQKQVKDSRGKHAHHLHRLFELDIGLGRGSPPSRPSQASGQAPQPSTVRPPALHNAARTIAPMHAPQHSIRARLVAADARDAQSCCHQTPPSMQSGQHSNPSAQSSSAAAVAVRSAPQSPAPTPPSVSCAPPSSADEIASPSPQVGSPKSPAHFRPPQQNPPPAASLQCETNSAKTRASAESRKTCSDSRTLPESSNSAESVRPAPVALLQ